MVIQRWLRDFLANRQLMLLVGFLLAAFLVLVLFGDMIAPVLAAIVIAFLLDGPADKLRSWGAPHLLAVILVFVGFLGIAFVGFFTILPPILNQVVQFAGALPGMLNDVKQTIARLPELYPGLIDQSLVDSLMEGIQRELAGLGQKALAFSVGSITSAIAFVVYAILVPVMVFFFLKDKRSILSWLALCLPKDRPLAGRVWDEVIAKTADYARGKVIEIVIVGFTTWAAFSVIGLRYAAFLAFLTGISVIIPYVGAAVVTVPVAVVAFVQWGAAPEFWVAVAAYLVIQALDGNLLAPLLYSEVVKLHPNAIILAILVFGGLWGFWGVFFAIPLATLAHAVIRAWPRKAVKGAKAKT